MESVKINVEIKETQYKDNGDIEMKLKVGERETVLLIDREKIQALAWGSTIMKACDSLGVNKRE